MTPNDIASIRLNNQQIASSNFRRAKDLVAWMGAMQAQDYNMSKWAIGVRLPDSTDQTIEEAFRKGEIIRTHLMRPTWHLVSSADIYWILELTSPHLKPMLRARFNRLELTEAVISKSKSVIEKALSGGNHLTREEIMFQLENAQIAAVNLRASHLMMACELDGIVCSGASKGKNQTYALLSERVPNAIKFSREEALAELARRYFTSHGPATIQDFIWWSGLPVKDAKNGLEMIKSDFSSEKVGQQIRWFSNPILQMESIPESAHLLPAYDEFIISYRDRSASILPEYNKKAISENGLFRPIVVVNGQVNGTWKRTSKKDKVLIEVDYFKIIEQLPENDIKNASERYGQFLNLKPEIILLSTNDNLNL